MEKKDLDRELPVLDIYYRKDSIIPKLLIGALGITIAIYSFGMKTTKGTIIGVGILAIIGIVIIRSIMVVSEKQPILRLTESGIYIKDLGLFRWSLIKSVKIRGPIGSSLHQSLDLKIKSNKNVISHSIRIDELEVNGKNILQKIEEYRNNKE
jgi:hypothetical protein